MVAPIVIRQHHAMRRMHDDSSPHPVEHLADVLAEIALAREGWRLAQRALAVSTASRDRAK
jgi:hypothetical protein